MLQDSTRRGNMILLGPQTILKTHALKPLSRLSLPTTHNRHRRPLLGLTLAS